MGITQLIRFTHARSCPFTDSVHKVRLQPCDKNISTIGAMVEIRRQGKRECSNNTRLHKNR